MKRTMRLITLITCSLAFFLHAGAQDRTNRITPSYRFEFRVSKSDTATTLYCVLKADDIIPFVKLNVSYNDKTRQYSVQSLLKEKSTEFFSETGLVYIRITEELTEPFIFIDGIDKMGRIRHFNEQSANGKNINAIAEKDKWKKAQARVDSMDYVRRYDNVYVGHDGKPRFRDNKGNVYVIENNSIHPDHN
jgi:hypothetical protein